ncbi:MAG: glycosyltransferase family 1 protein [Bacteroidota bacterium]
MSGTSPIYINGKFLCQKATGVQKYALGISLALQKQHPDIEVLVPKGKNHHNGLQVKERGWGSGFIWEQIWLPLFLLFHRHSMLINFCNTAPLCVKNQIVTIHDLAFLHNKDWFSSAFRQWYRFLIPRICRKSKKIICVSEFIKKEICESDAVAADKIMVIPNGVPEMEFDEQKPYSFNYLLLTGIYNPRKNAQFVLSLLPEIKKRNFHIVGVGAKTDIFGKAEFPADECLHLLEYVDEKQYYSLLKHADALLFPSEYEGFGIPVIESLMLGTPVIVPDVEVYRESFADLPLYYSASDANSFIKALEKINNYKPASKELLFLKNKFNFDASAETLFESI